MATTQRRSTVDAASSVPAPFSYAQAAKGMATPATSGGNASKPASGTVTPARDSTSTQATGGLINAPANASWAEDAETQFVSATKELDTPSIDRESLLNGVSSSQGKGAASGQTITTSRISSPELGTTTSSSTLGKDDDIASLQNASSESTWENKSQTSNVEKKEKADSAQETGKDGEKEKTPPKVLQDAPIPAVNVWKIRAEEHAKIRTTVPASTSKKAQGTANPKFGEESTRKNKSDDTSLPTAPGKDRRQATDARRAKDDDYSPPGRRDTRSEGDSKRRAVGRGKDIPSAPLPPTRDQESWPTPESAQDEERRRTLEKEKGDKSEKERGAAPASRSHGKNEWVPVPYTPTVVFNTPMPNSAARRGGRGGARGASQASGRGGAYNVSGVNAVTGDKEAVLTNGDAPKRAKPEGNARRDQSPSKSRSANHGAPAPWKEQKANAAVKSSTDGSQSDGNDVKKPVSEDAAPVQSVSQTAGSRSVPGRQKPGRKPDTTGTPEKRRDGEVVSPAQADQADKKSGPNGESQGPKSAGPDRRNGPFGTYPGREREPRGRGGIRGGRGNHSSFSNSSHTNGQTFVNGNGSTQGASSFSNPKSPTTFYPEQSGGYFPASQRPYGRNGARSQSISTDSMYGRVQGGFPAGGQNLPPIQTFMNPPYDYQLMQPISAVPWTPYIGQDQLFSILTTQIEYYFSIENLCKDMFLRKHMDSKGFVFLSVISDFNRIKQLSTDLELIKLACYHSREVEYRVGTDGKDRLRRREGWEQWRLPLGDRDASAQNDGPDELHHPPVPHPQGFASGVDAYLVRFPIGPGSPGAPHHDSSFPGLNGAGINGTVPNGPVGEPVGPVYPATHGNIEPETFANVQDPAQDSTSSNLVAPSKVSINGQNLPEELPNFEVGQNGPHLNGHVPTQG